MSRILDWETPIKLLPAVEKYFKDVAPLQQEPLRSQFANIRESTLPQKSSKRLCRRMWGEALPRRRS
jgi:hypothetical protein